MTERLYYDDAYTTKFQANIVERFRHDDRLAIVLDRTYFYPTSGGQPADHGHLQGSPVVDVIVREEDDAIIHLVAGEIWSDDVTGEIDWERRFDHMQQHTGQHILSQAFIRSADARTVSFHLGEESVTIDLHRADLEPAQVEQAELLANRIVWENRPVHIRYVAPEQAEMLDLRKVPPITDKPLRLVDIEEFDLTACGGTHVARTGAVGLIKIVKLERRGDELRVDFRCGRRALSDYRQKNRIINQLAATFTTGYWNLEDRIADLRAEATNARRQLQEQQAELLEYRAERMLATATRRGDARIVTQVFTDLDGAQLRILANHLAAHAGVVALLGVAGEPALLVFARAEDVPGRVNDLLKRALQVLGDGGGGGSETFAQGGSPAGDEARVRQALDRAEKLLLAQLP